MEDRAYCRQYFRITPEMIVEILKGDIVTKLPDGGIRRVTSDMPKDANAVRAWVGEQGDVFITFESESCPLVQEGYRMEQRRVTCYAWEERHGKFADYERLFNPLEIEIPANSAR